MSAAGRAFTAGTAAASVRRRPARRSLADRWLLLEAAVALVAARLAVGRWPVARAGAVLERAWRRLPPGVGDASPERVARAVAGVAARFSRRACVVEALATRLLLARRGLRAPIRVEFRRDAGRLVGHAWVDVPGRRADGAPAPLGAGPAPPRVPPA
jgi:hypothetical protein